MYGGSAENIRYSRLKQINASNVHRLQVAWTFETGDAFRGSEMQCNPLIIDGVLYATTPKLRVIALNADTGRLKWEFDPNEGKRVTGKMRNRGLTYWAQGSDQRIYFGARQYLYALDAKTGKPALAFGNAGRVDMRDDLGRDPEQMSVGLTSPGIVYKDLLIVGSIVSESLPSSPGDIRAYDVRSGKLRWSFHTIPHPGEYGYETWPKDGWRYLGGANDWTGMSLDPKRGIVFVPTGSAAFDFYGANRLGDNLFANCLLALNAQTGERIWHFQTVKHDVWDRDLPSPPALVTVNRNGRSVDAVAQPTKSGFVYLFERQTGRPLFPIEEKKYPASDVDGEVTARTQPLPAQPPPFARQTLTEPMLTTRTPEAHEAVLAQFRKLRSAGQFVPPSREGTVVFPGFDGGAEWGGSAFDPETGLLYVNSNEMAWILRLVERRADPLRTTASGLYRKQCASCHREDMRGTPPEFPSLLGLSERTSAAKAFNIVHEGAGRMPAFTNLKADAIRAIVEFVMHGSDSTLANSREASPIDLKYEIDGYNRFLDPEGYPAIQPPWGTLNAINLNSGKIKWQIPLGEYPQLVQSGMRNTGSENYGGPVVTAGGLVFIAATNFDNKFRAFDKKTGALLWQTTLPAAGNATPAIYEVGGRQFIVIACGGGKSGALSGGAYVTFALPGAE
ncbi:MAG: pyrroloquinoline quinone-dependent dehydrogenase [Acidobacteriota bacterium]|nr:pyrroloquinoline quinone-dependent dehydrogenase [Acidobacteriota bacterium]